MIAIAAIAMTLVHPAFVFGDCWKTQRAREVLSFDSGFEMRLASSAADKPSHEIGTQGFDVR